jgi:ABC-type multidrug transport system ATPase subunit
MLQRIGLAKALVHEPLLVVLDEPTAGVDPAGSREIQDLILELKRRGITVLLITHEADIAEYGTRLIRFRDGRVVAEGRWRTARDQESDQILLADASPKLIEEIITVAEAGSARGRATQIETDAGGAFSPEATRTAEETPSPSLKKRQRPTSKLNSIRILQLLRIRLALNVGR